MHTSTATVSVGMTGQMGSGRGEKYQQQLFFTPVGSGIASGSGGMVGTVGESRASTPELQGTASSSSKRKGKSNTQNNEEDGMTKPKTRTRKSAESKKKDKGSISIRSYMREFEFHVFSLLEQDAINLDRINTLGENQEHLVVQIAFSLTKYLLEDLESKLSKKLVPKPTTGFFGRPAAGAASSSNSSSSSTAVGGGVAMVGENLMLFSRVDGLSAETVVSKMIRNMPALCSVLERCYSELEL
ncbi:hypothetical protein HK098_000560, partial [Nowakowskiella sp. JEL0407]